MIFYASGILEMKGTLVVSCMCISFFAIQRHLFQNFGTVVCSGDQSSSKDDFQAPLGTPRFSFFLANIAIH